MGEVKIIITEDGSHSLYHAELNETYHSFHGAVQESRYVFLKEGLDFLLLSFGVDKIRVLEVGFGTGLNAILTSEWAAAHRVKIEYTTLEPFPLKSEVYEALNYHEFFEDKTVKERFLELHNAAWEKKFEQNEFFTILKTEAKLQDFTTDSLFDIVFFDAFAPSKQAEMWNLEVIKKTAGLLDANGVFITYCAKGQLKRDLSAVGLTVETLPGPPGKKEMVRGVKR
ncbi:tRNA (5-methylaminomethyl-2-thiouridine)(34)-methyltransferase MnmD [Roseivirga echinicomitans]|uniref:Methyltransferase n=1 Tax=Roseivirga echinicomitans TaxID=296218 RepID=A0A150XJS8_9BACT|nr:tRNA (5-methylaminomethyl-2-thiouridine)(34)-methyltransferase MnmD [Roseivirga echinicomitans]KYG78953.1 methyltransferase [Roseivirga echinicomitans]